MGDVGFLKMVMQEIAIILQVLFVKNPKYVREILCQMYIPDTQVAHPELQNVYIVNTLVNLWGLFFNFYKINLVLKYQNKEFKCFCANRGSFLQKTVKIF